jgi:hypothetical protein
MFTIPQKVKNVSVYPYIDVIGHGPQVEPVLANGVGTYTFSSFGTCLYLGLDLSSADHKSQLFVHDKYYAVCERESDGSTFTTNFMFCSQKGSTPEFSLNKCLGKPDGPGDDMVENISVPAFNVLTPLTNVTVSQLLPGPVIGQTTLISGASGHIIATQVGAPHLMGVEVQGGMRSDQLRLGMGRIIITGLLPNGRTHTVANYTCASIADPAIFFMTFPG